MERKMELATAFREIKVVLHCPQETPKKMKKMLGFTEAFLPGSDNFKTSGLSDHDKSKMQVQAINKGKYIKRTKRGENYYPTL